MKTAVGAVWLSQGMKLLVVGVSGVIKAWVVALSSCMKISALKAYGKNNYGAAFRVIHGVSRLEVWDLSARC